MTKQTSKQYFLKPEKFRMMDGPSEYSIWEIWRGLQKGIHVKNEHQTDEKAIT